MKKLISLLAIVSSCLLFSFQSEVALTESQVKVETVQAEYKVIEVSFDNGLDQIKENISAIQGKVVFVDYVYTTFDSKSEFMLSNLDKLRFIRLLEKFPELKNVEQSKWKTTSKLVSSKAEGRQEFNGFRIYYIPVVKTT